MIRFSIVLGTAALALTGCNATLDTLFNGGEPPVAARAPADPVKADPGRDPSESIADAAETVTAVPAPVPKPKPSMTVTEVMGIQRALQHFGYDPGPIDGLIGPQTSAAVRAFQTAAGLPVDGRVTRALGSYLNEQLVAAQTQPAASGVAAETPEKAAADRPGVISRILRPLFGN